MREAIEAFVDDENVLDPLGTQLIRLRVGEKKAGTLCGYANLKNRYGAFEDFGLFFDQKREILAIMPSKDKARRVSRA